MTVYWRNSSKPRPLPRFKPGQKATRNGRPAWQVAAEEQQKQEKEQ